MRTECKVSYVYVTPANVQDRAGACFLLARLGPLVPRLKKIWVDGVYSSPFGGPGSRRGGQTGNTTGGGVWLVVGRTSCWRIALSGGVPRRWRRR